MLAAEEPDLAAALLFLSYPLHPPEKPANLRTEHFPSLRTPALFVSGDRDGFGTPKELQAAVAIIPARTHLMMVTSAGHELLNKKTQDDLPPRIVQAFLGFIKQA